MSLADHPHYSPIIVVATGTMNAGGTESLIMEMLRHASGRVRYIMLIHHDGNIQEGIFDSEIRKLGIEMYYIPSVGSLGIKGYIKAFANFVESIEVPIDIIHSHLNGASGIIALAAKKAGVRHRICHCHADIHYTGGLLSRIKNELALAGMKVLIDLYATDRWACSIPAWNRLYMPWRKRVVIDNMIDTRLYLSSTDKIAKKKSQFGLDGKYVVGAVGRVAPIKNYELILRAIVKTDAHFVCFGRFDLANSYCKRLDSLAHELGIADRVHWMGNSNNISEDIHCIDLFVMPSFTEGFGMAAIEAQAAGIPSLLSTGVPSTVDLDIGLAEFIESNDIETWQAKIDACPMRPETSPETILHAFKRKGFDAPTSVKDIENRYLTL